MVIDSTGAGGMNGGSSLALESGSVGTGGFVSKTLGLASTEAGNVEVSKGGRVKSRTSECDRVQ